MSEFSQAVKSMIAIDLMDKEEVVMPNWGDIVQPIGTAPKDGTEILVKNRLMENPVRRRAGSWLKQRNTLMS